MEQFSFNLYRCLLDIIQPFDGCNSKSVVIHHLSRVIDLITAAGALGVSAKHGLWILDWTRGLDSGLRYGLYACMHP